MSEWQPIETAPKGIAITLGKWSVDDGCWYWIASATIEPDGLFVDVIDDTIQGQWFQEPTHWQPLPTPPHTGKE